MDCPLQLPEILFYIAPYLTQQSLVNCLSVCRQWNHSFTPLIFRTVTASEDWSTAKDFPSLPSLVKNAQSVRSLTLKTTQGLSPFLEQCTCLKTLVVLGNIFSNQDCNVWSDLESLIRRNPMIECVFLGFNRDSSPPTKFLRALAESCPNLQRYESSQGKYETQEQLDALLKVLQNVRVASTRYECFTGIHVDTSKSFPHMTDLTFKDTKGLSIQAQVDLVCQCPNLEHLRWTVCRDTLFPVQQFCKRIPAACPNLRKFQMDGCGISYSDDLSRILSSLSPLELFSCCGTAIFKQTFRSLTRHFPALQFLDLADCFSVKSWMVQEILESCPLLEILKVPYLMMSDVKTGKPWVSLRLKHLRVHIRHTALFWSDRLLQHQAIFKSLGQLTDLRILDTSFEPQGPEGLEYRLCLGLSSLESLKKLTILKANNTMQLIEDEDLNWIKTYWPMLTKVEGIFHSDWEKHELVTKELRKCGIEVPEQEELSGLNDIGDWVFNSDDDHEEDEDEYYYLENDEGEETLSEDIPEISGIVQEQSLLEE
ncbi:hypothetical protein FBU30_005769 [Linnemannia zychae]|nr:hypothetical protein FBU30_005769 [Linnemannia zychae]